MAIIHGSRLNEAQRKQVLAAFVHRHTIENAKQTYGGKCVLCEQSTRGGHIVTGVSNPGAMEAPLKVWTRAEWHAYHVPAVTDAEWLTAHAFHFVKDGSRLMERRHAEPAFMANAELA